MNKHANRAKTLAAAALAATTLAGCATSGSGKPEIRLPPLPAHLAKACPDPGVREGADALLELARNREARAVCSRRHGDTVAFYAGIRNGFNTD